MELEFRNITKKYGKKTAVNDVSFTLKNGVTALLGANGSGKTTLMRMLADVIKPTEGKITLDGRDIKILDGDYRALLGYLPQNFGYYKDFTAYDFLMYMSAIKGIEKNFAKNKCEELLCYVGLSDEKNKKVKTFSGGMRQRLGIAQALLNDPYILILDEPTAGLDPKERVRFRNMMNEIGKDRIIIYATHIVSDISYIAERVLIMKGGDIIADSTPNELVEFMKGKVWVIESQRENLNSLSKNYTVGNITPAQNGLYKAKIISDTPPLPSAASSFPELEDVYLYYFKEVDTYDENR